MCKDLVAGGTIKLLLPGEEDHPRVGMEQVNPHRFTFWAANVAGTYSIHNAPRFICVKS